MCSFQRWVELTQYMLDSSVRLTPAPAHQRCLLTAGILQSACVWLTAHQAFKVCISFHLSHASILDVSAQEFPLHRT